MSTATDIDPTHRDDCPGARLGTFVGKQGDTITRCTGCGRIVVHPTPRPEQSKPAGAPVRYVCREHHEPVTPKGKGCTICSRPRKRERPELPAEWLQ